MNKNKYLTTDAIILNYSTFREYDRNFYFISPDYGIIQATAFGSEKLKSKFCSVIQPFVKARLYLTKSSKSNFLKLSDISDVNTNDFIKKDISFIYILSFYVEILLNSYLMPEEYKAYYYLLDYSIKILEDTKEIYTSLLFFCAKYLVLYGYNFNFNFCKKCTQISSEYFFNPKEISFYCPKCSENKNFFLSYENLLILKDFFEKKYIFLKEKKINKNNFILIYNILIEIIKNIFNDKELKTLNNLNTIIY